MGQFNRNGNLSDLTFNGIVLCDNQLKSPGKCQIELTINNNNIMTYDKGCLKSYPQFEENKKLSFFPLNGENMVLSYM